MSEPRDRYSSSGGPFLRQARREGQRTRTSDSADHFRQHIIAMLHDNRRK